MQRAVAIETTRGWRIAKDKASHKIDIVVALAQAAYAAVQKGEQSWGRVGAIDTDGFVHWHGKDEHQPLRIRTVHITEQQAIEQGMRFK